MVLGGRFFQRSRHIVPCASCKVHTPSCLPALTDCTLLVRYSANLWLLQVILQWRLVPAHWPATAPGQVLTPCPSVSPRVVGGGRGWPGTAASGSYAAQRVPNDGVTSGGRVPRCGDAGARGRQIVATVRALWTEPWAVARRHVRYGPARCLRQGLAHAHGPWCAIARGMSATRRGWPSHSVKTRSKLHRIG